MPDEGIIKKKLFKEIPLDDHFFDSLREAYSEFNSWYRRKANEIAYVVFDNSGAVQAFLYLKKEIGAVTDITPPLNTGRCLKIGTFKINAHGTRLGERFVKKIFDESIVNNIKHIYVTVFPDHEPLINILKRYGFEEYGIKKTTNGIEKVFLKDLNKIHQDALLDYPTIDSRKRNKWLLAIYPIWHTKLFPDSILKTENNSIIGDLSFSNSIHKVYIAWMEGMDTIRTGDIIVIYRTAEKDGTPWFQSVATSLCVVEEARKRSSFSSLPDFIEYCKKNSVFSEKELTNHFKKQCKNEMVVLRMTYNIALPKRPTMQRLVDEAGLSRTNYWGFRSISDEAFKRIIKIGEVYEGTIIH